MITQVIYVERSRLFFAACLDDTLKLYSDNFRLQASFKWHGGIVASMLFNAACDELITAGRNGVKVWYCQPDYKAFARNAATPLKTGSKSGPVLGSTATLASKLKGGKAPPWQLGAFQSIRERVTFRQATATQHADCGKCHVPESVSGLAACTTLRPQIVPS